VVLTDHIGPTYQCLLKGLAQVRFLTFPWEICQDDW